jgi:nucleoside-diphosphate kinase
MELSKVTFAMIKPDAVAKKNSGKIIDMIEHNGFEIVRLQKVMISLELAEEFYSVHKDKPFFEELVTFVTSAPVIIMALYKDNAINEWRTLIGATDPAKAETGTIRQLFGTSISNNVVHGSDSAENATEELSLFFPDLFGFSDEDEDDDSDDEDECDEDDACCDDEDECDGEC